MISSFFHGKRSIGGNICSAETVVLKFEYQGIVGSDYFLTTDFPH